MPIRNLFDGVPARLPDELTHTLLERDGLRIERIVSRGQASPDHFWYDQNEHEWVLLLQGSAGLSFEGEANARELKPGDFILIPAGTRHRVAWTAADGATIWLAVFFRAEAS